MTKPLEALRWSNLLLPLLFLISIYSFSSSQPAEGRFRSKKKEDLLFLHNNHRAHHHNSHSNNNFPPNTTPNNYSFIDILHQKIYYHLPIPKKSETPSQTALRSKDVPLQYKDATLKVIDMINNHRYTSNDSYELSIREKFKGKYFYIYNLTEEFWWRWPKNGTQQSCIENGYLGHEHAVLSAIGRPIIPEDGLFLTWHFSMFNSLFNRLKRSSRRTNDPEKASLFIIPYDIGLDGYLDPNTCNNRRQCSNGLVGKLTKILSNSKYFQRYQGGDHVILWSLGQYHPWPHAGCDVFMKDFCAKCTLTCYWMDATKAENRFVSMPFPAAYHWWDGIQNIPWDIRNIHQRNLTAVYLGSTQTLNPAHTKIRRAMANQCNISTECHWMKIAHSSIDNSIGNFLSIYKRAIFCLCPPGDDPARKAVFDAIVSGCIPVIFELATLYNQYPWHIGEQAALDISVYIPGGQIRTNKIDLMKVLLEIKPEVIYAKQLAIAELAPRIQYAIPPITSLENKYDETRWDPPFHDAAEIAIDGFFERTDNIIHNESTRIPHRLMSGREWGQEYDSVKIEIPHFPLTYGPIVNGKKLKDREKAENKIVSSGSNP